MWRRPAKSNVAPQRSPDGGNGTRKRRTLFDIPGGLPNRQTTSTVVRIGEQRHQWIETQQHRGGPLEGQVIPLPLHFDIQMSAHLRKGRLHLPALNEPANDLLWGGCHVGTLKRLDASSVPGASGKRPAKGNHRLTAVTAHSYVGGDLDFRLTQTVPAMYQRRAKMVVQLVACLSGSRTRCPSVGRRSPFLGGPPNPSLLSLPSLLPLLPRLCRTRWSRFIETGVQPQACCHRDRGRQSDTGIQQRELGAAWVRNEHQSASRQPAAHLHDHLSRPPRESPMSALDGEFSLTHLALLLIYMLDCLSPKEDKV